MIKDLISLRGHLGWRCHLCNIEVITSTREKKRTVASISISTVGREVMECRFERNSGLLRHSDFSDEETGTQTH